MTYYLKLPVASYDECQNNSIQPAHEDFQNNIVQRDFQNYYFQSEEYGQDFQLTTIEPNFFHFNPPNPIPEEDAVRKYYYKS